MTGFSSRQLDRYRVKAGGKDFKISTLDPSGKELFQGEKEEGQATLEPILERIRELQDMLWAEHHHSLLMVLQAMDTGGKDGTIRRVFGPLNPQGFRVAGFKKPIQEELDHDFLWRIHAHTPGRGEIAVFNRSHYEDVLVVRVHGQLDPERCRERYRSIREFERTLVQEGTTLVKVFLHISPEEQKVRLLARLATPEKRWKFNTDDLAERRLWDDYTQAYEDALSATSTSKAPWYVVPADRKWYRNLVVASLLLRTLESMALRYPDPPHDLAGIEII